MVPFLVGDFLQALDAPDLYSVMVHVLEGPGEVRVSLTPSIAEVVMVEPVITPKNIM